MHYGVVSTPCCTPGPISAVRHSCACTSGTCASFLHQPLRDRDTSLLNSSFFYVVWKWLWSSNEEANFSLTNFWCLSGTPGRLLLVKVTYRRRLMSETLRGEVGLRRQMISPPMQARLGVPRRWLQVRARLVRKMSKAPGSGSRTQ